MTQEFTQQPMNSVPHPRTARLDRERGQSALREFERKRPCCSRARAGKLKIIGINESNQCQYRSISDGVK